MAEREDPAQAGGWHGNFLWKFSDRKMRGIFRGAAPQRLVHFHPARLFFMPGDVKTYPDNR